ncbi:MAG: AI-2E family transporter [Opitutales bacterium]|nr:AI-2E family transporter [Opitutales bacterium]
MLITSLLLILFLAMWKAAEVLLLAFAGILLALILRTAANVVSRWTRLKVRWALSLVLLLLTAATVGTVWLAAPRIASEFGELRENLAASVDQLAHQVMRLPGGEAAADKANEMQENMDNDSEIWKQIGGIFSSTFGAIAGILICGVIGLFLAYDPRLYLAGLLRLVPLEKRERSSEVITAMGKTLQGWILGQLISMVFLFATTWIMLALLGVPLAFILALLTGILTFVPYIGPILAAIPILLVALVESPQLALYTGLLFLVVQNVESNIIMPLIFQRTVHLPPALSIVGQLILGGMFGVLGFILATPLTAVAVVLAKKLYVEDVLTDSMENEVEEMPTLENQNPAS